MTVQLQMVPGVVVIKQSGLVHQDCELFLLPQGSQQVVFKVPFTPEPEIIQGIFLTFHAK